MPRTKAPKLSSENSVVSDALKSLQIEQEDFKKFRADIDVITCKYSLEFPFWGVIFFNQNIGSYRWNYSDRTYYF